MGKTRKLQIGDIVKVVKDETGELQDCVGEVAGYETDRFGVNEDNIGVAFGKADNTTLLVDFAGNIIADGKWGAWFERRELRYSPNLKLSPIRCVPE